MADQRLVRVARGAVARERGGQHRDAGVGDAQRLAALAVAQALHPAGGEQLHLDQILAGPAGGAPDRAQAAAMQFGQYGGGFGEHQKSIRLLPAHGVSFEQ